MIRPSSLPVSPWTAVIVISQLMAEDLVCHIDMHILPLSMNAVKLFSKFRVFPQETTDVEAGSSWYSVIP